VMFNHVKFEKREEAKEAILKRMSNKA
jgi:hypothetical protein